MLKIKTDSIKDLFAPDKDILVIAGPCSAENENQVLTTARQIADTGKVLLPSSLSAVSA